MLKVKLKVKWLFCLVLLLKALVKKQNNVVFEMKP